MKLNALSVGAARLTLVLIALAAYATPPFAAASTSGKRTLTVADSIGMTRLSDPEVEMPFGPHEFKISPDGSHFVIVTRKGNLTTLENDFELRLYNSAEVLAAVSSTNKPQPQGTVLARFSSQSNEGRSRHYAIREVKWFADNVNVAFIGDNGREPGQVYRVNINDRKVEALTRHARAVLTFDLNARADTMVFLAEASRHGGEEYWKRSSFVVDTKDLNEVAHPQLDRHLRSLYVQYHVLKLGQTQSSRPVGEIFDVMFSPKGPMSVSPGGRWAVVSMPITVDSPAAKRWFARYSVLNTSRFYKKKMQFDENTSKPDMVYDQFFIIDVEAGNLRPAFDAPVASISAGGLFAQARWHSDDAVILPPTFLPPSRDGAVEQAPAVIEYQLTEDRVAVITSFEIDANKDASSQQLGRLYLTKTGNAMLLLEVRASGKEQRHCFRKAVGRWERTKLDCGRTDVAAGGRLELSIHQDLNTAPEILARDLRTGRSRTITHLNPQFDELTFGHTERFSWSGAQGRSWVGGITYPPGFVAGRQYPLVIQTHGFEEDKFLIDGPYSTAIFAAQLLANQGMLVLSAPDDYTELGSRAELTINQDCIESALEKLQALGLIDPHKVGISGFSRSGFYVDQVITFSKHDFAAAYLSDAALLSFMSPAEWFGLAGGMDESEKMLGGGPWGEGLRAVMANSSTLNLDRMKTPLYLETFLDSSGYRFSYWDHYAFLRRLHKPVELRVFPKANHLTISPGDLRDAKQSVVDWFAFWLKGKEDSDPAKAAQYERWRKFKLQQVESAAAADAVRRRQP